MFFEYSRSSYGRLDTTGCGMFKLFEGGRWLIFQDKISWCYEKVDKLRLVIYIEFVKLSEGMVID
jgi:hypothetical protein